jgi:hypothetical protein
MVGTTLATDTVARGSTPTASDFGSGRSGPRLRTGIELPSWAIRLRGDKASRNPSATRICFSDTEMDRPNADPLLPWPTLDAWLLRNSVLYDMTNRAWEQFEAAAGLVESYPHYMERNLRDPNAPNAREADRLLRGFFDRARRAGVAAGAVFFPNPGYLAKDYPFDYLHERVQATCADERVPCLDLRAPFAATFRVPQLMWVSRFDQHPNARANRKAAQEIAARFGSVWHR